MDKWINIIIKKEDREFHKNIKVGSITEINYNSRWSEVKLSYWGRKYDGNLSVIETAINVTEEQYYLLLNFLRSDELIHQIIIEEEVK